MITSNRVTSKPEMRFKSKTCLFTPLPIHAAHTLQAMVVTSGGVSPPKAGRSADVTCAWYCSRREWLPGMSGSIESEKREMMFSRSSRPAWRSCKEGVDKHVDISESHSKTKKKHTKKTPRHTNNTQMYPYLHTVHAHTHTHSTHIHTAHTHTHTQHTHTHTHTHTHSAHTHIPGR